MELKNVTSLRDWWKIRKLYKSAFPVYERKPLWLIWQKKREGCTDVWAIENEGKFSGLAITINGEDIVLLDYFAISDNKRGKGLGTLALTKLQEHYKTKRFLLEIESVFEEVDDLENRIRRKQFYLNNNMKEMHIMVNLFGTKFELLACNGKVSYEDYRLLYHTNYGEWATEQIKQEQYPNS